MPGTLFTIGYEGLDFETVIARLQANGIETLVDVRALPLSHKRGFSKTALSASLAAAGIGYVHLRALGAPADIRHRYKADGDWPRFARGYRAWLSGQTEALAELAALAARQRCCLICFERDFARCHRSICARAIAAETGIAVAHIMDGGLVADTP